MKKSSLIGLAIGAAVAAFGALAVGKITKEMKEETFEQLFVSPNGDNRVTLACGTSKSANGLTCVKILAESDSSSGKCKLMELAMKNDGMFDASWVDNAHFKLITGKGKRKQCCDVTFEDNNINAVYYLLKVSE